MRPEPGSVESAEKLSLSPAFGNAWIVVNRLLKAGAEVSRDPRDGTFYLSNAGVAQSLLPGLARSLGLRFSSSSGNGDARRLRAPRIGLYKSFVPNMDEGWTRWILEQFEFPYASLGNREIRAGRLLEKYDVILLPDAAPQTMEFGFRARGGNREASTAMPEEYSGGLGEAGAAALQDFVTAGGTILAFNRASLYAIERLHAAAGDVLRGVSNREFYAPGSLLTAVVETSHPLAFGMEKQVAVWSESSPAFEPSFDSPNPPAVPVLKYPPANPLASGWLLGGSLIENRGVVMDAPVGKGHIILFGIRPQYRAQSHATFKLLFNGLFAYAVNTE